MSEKPFMDSEMDKIASAMAYTAGAELRKIMLEGGMTVDEIEKMVKGALGDVVICGVPLRAAECTHCKGRGWNMPEEEKARVEYQVLYSPDGIYHIPDHAGDTIKILRRREEK